MTSESQDKQQAPPSFFQNPTLLLLGLIGAVDAADAKVLPALFRFLERDFQYGPEKLSMLMIGQSLCMALASPLWGYLSDSTSMKRSSLLALGCLTWGVATVLMAYTNTFAGFLLQRSLAGVALACMMPLSQSIVAGLTPEAQRGSVFGILMGVAALGAFGGGLFATSLGGRENVAQMAGWRFVLLVVGLLPILLGLLVPVIMKTPTPSHTATKGRKSSGAVLRQLCQVRTFQLITLQGCFGAVPWNALSFSTLWLQKCGFTDVLAASIVSWHTIGAAMGVAIGGRLGDVAAKRNPSKGRVRVAQTSKFLSISISFTLFTLLPQHSFFILSSAFFLLGIVSSWTPSGVNRPILSEVVPASQCSSIMAWEIALEGSSAALFGAPVVGMLAERVFGYNTGSSDGQDALALSRAMRCMILVPWIVCFTVYGWVGHVYEGDRKRARRENQGQDDDDATELLLS